MKIELKNYLMSINDISNGCSVSKIINYHKFFRLKGYPANEIYFRDNRFANLENINTITSLKQNNLLEFIDIDDIELFSTLFDLSDAVHIYVANKLINSIQGLTNYNPSICKDVDRLTKHLNIFYLEFDYSKITIAKVFINRIDPKSSYIEI